MKGPSEFEKQLIEIMVDEKCTMKEALDCAFSLYSVNTTNVIDLVDFLEDVLYDLDKVQMMMEIYTGQIPDLCFIGTFSSEKKTQDYSDKD